MASFWWSLCFFVGFNFDYDWYLFDLLDFPDSIYRGIIDNTFIVVIIWIPCIWAITMFKNSILYIIYNFPFNCRSNWNLKFINYFMSALDWYDKKTFYIQFYWKTITFMKYRSSFNWLIIGDNYLINMMFKSDRIYSQMSIMIIQKGQKIIFSHNLWTEIYYSYLILKIIVFYNTK